MITNTIKFKKEVRKMSDNKYIEIVNKAPEVEPDRQYYYIKQLQNILMN